MAAWSLKNRFILMALAPSVFISLFLGAFLIYTRVNDLEDFIAERGKSTSQQLASVSRHALANHSSKLLQELVNATLEESGVRSVVIYDKQGVMVVMGGPKMMPPLDQSAQHLGDSLGIRNTARSQRFVRPVFTNNLIAENPDGLNEKEVLGWVEVEYSYSNFTIRAYQTILISALLMLLAIVTTGTLAIQVNKSVSDTIRRLGTGIRQLRKGHLDKRIDVGDRSELGNLASEINRMAGALQDTLSEMESNVDQSTSDLRETLETIEIQNIELDLARREALEASRIKSEFLANTSHEIRTPLNGIIGFTNLLLNTEVNPRQQDYLRTIRESSENLLTIINDILDFSKIEAGKLVLEHLPVKLRELFEDVLNMLARNAHDKGLELSLLVHADVPETISADPLRIKQVLTNLVTNAIKFTDSGYIVVRIRHEHTTDNRALLTISVTDSGIGLSAKQQQALFTPFNQADSSTSREFGGTGLGLVISKRLVEQMGGDIGVDSDPGKGASFWFSLNANLCADPDGEKIFDALRGKSIAMIEPNPTSNMAVSQLLESWQVLVADYQSVEQLSGQAGSLASDASIVALDNDQLHNMPELAEQIYQACPGPIIFTYRPGHDAYEGLVEQGNHHCLLSKPVSRQRLYDALLNLSGEPASTLASTSRRASAGQHAPRVLAVDDNAANLKLLLIILEELGIEAVPADSGIEALKLTEKSVFDLIFMDIQMPELDGVEATRRLRTAENNPNRNTPIVALTAHALAEEKRQLLSAGMNDHIAKPIDHTMLKRALVTWCMNFQSDKVAAPEEQSSGRTAEADANRQPVDLKLCLKRANNHNDLAREMLESLLKNLTDDRQQIESAFAQADWDALLEAVHKLHGATCYTGVPELGSILRKLETAVKQQHEQDIRYLLPQLRQVIEELVNWQDEHDIAVLFD